ncbi:MAG: UvrD-helicase domain-containing protein [Verrucomicrobiales bacterium]|nr:UvrD-helicase domain-containing protein [Verrucomicrobiales bacterium]
MARVYNLNTGGGADGQPKIDFDAELNPQQLAAVKAPPGPALVIAGAGSGKTRTLTYRVAYLLENGIRPENILLLTFTNKAAREMIERVSSLVSLDSRALWSGTFHSIGNRILRRHAERVGMDRNFSIMDREDQKSLMTSVVKDSGLDIKALQFPKPQLLSDMFSMARNTGANLRDHISENYAYYDHLSDEILKMRDAYQDKKLDTNSMDFDDLLIKTLTLLREHDDLRELYQHQFEFVLVDEYQDTNLIQSDMIDLLSGEHGNLMVVGDDAQSIYSWRGADFRNILNFAQQYPGAQTYKIETNYRSVPEILSLANSAIRGNTEQFEKELVAHRPDQDTLPALVMLSDTNTQAIFVAQRIQELLEEGVEAKEIAVLYRAHYQAMELQMELTRQGLDFNITSGLRFFEQAHVKDVATFMKFVANRSDEVSFLRMVKMLPGIGEISARKLWQQWQKCEGAKLEKVDGFSKYLLDFKVPVKAAKDWKQLTYTLDELVDVDGELQPPSMMITSIVEGVYDDYMRAQFSNYENRKMDIEQLENFSADFEQVAEFLTQLSLLAGTDTDVSGKSKRNEKKEDAVCLSSVHQAKGLEWKVVFVIWLAEGMFPNSRVLEDDYDDSGLEEERRLFYVAVTRAMDELYLTYPLIWPQAHSGQVMQTPSRFLSEIPTDQVEEWKVAKADW